MKKLKEIIEEHKRKSLCERADEIRDSFNVVESGGVLWLTHNGMAFYKVPQSYKAEEVAMELENARDSALEFEGL